MRKTATLAALFLAGALLAPVVALADSTITAAGSTALLPLVKEAAAEYQAKHPDVKIAVSGGGSGTGINQVVAKAIDIGNSDIAAVGQPTLVDHKVAVTGFAIVAHPGVGVTNLTRKQLQDIFSGKTQSWKDVGGADVKITVTDLLTRACATALSAHPEVNVSWDETRILRYRHVNIGVAVAIDDADPLGGRAELLARLLG